MRKTNRKYEVRPLGCDWALDIPLGDTTVVLYFNSRNNAELVKDVLEWEDNHPNEAATYQPTLTPPNEPARAGLYGKYTVRKNSDGSLVTDCFVLRPNKDLAAVAALRAYAAATDNAELAVDIINWVGADPNEPLTLEQLREMDGKPAYIPETNCWVLVTKNPFVPLFTWPDGEQCSAYDWYEQVGPVYRRPPERQEDDHGE